MSDKFYCPHCGRKDLTLPFQQPHKCAHPPAKEEARKVMETSRALDDWREERVPTNEVLKPTKISSCAVPPAQEVEGKMEEEAEAYANLGVEPPIPKNEAHEKGRVKQAYLAGARSRDARIAELEKDLAAKKEELFKARDGHTAYELAGTITTLRIQLAEAQERSCEYCKGTGAETITSLRAALEQVKAERDELKKRAAHYEQAEQQIIHDAERIASLEEGLRESLGALICADQALKNHGDDYLSHQGDNGPIPKARALLAAGEKAGGE